MDALNQGCNANFVRYQADKTTALMAACLHGRGDIVIRLIESGSDMKLLDNEDRSAVDFAKIGKHFDIVTELRNFMFKNVYLPVSDSKPAKSAMKMVSLIFDYLMTNPDKVPEYLLNICDGNVEKACIDYITGMTDDYALRFSEKFDKTLALDVFEGRL